MSTLASMMLPALLAYTPQQMPSRAGHAGRQQLGRRQLLLGAGAAALVHPVRSSAEDVKEKLKNLPPAKLAEIVRTDLVDRQFLATADFTREIYDEAALFTDESEAAVETRGPMTC